MNVNVILLPYVVFFWITIMSIWAIVSIVTALIATAAIGYFLFYFFVAPRSAVAHGITQPKEVAGYRDDLLRGPVQFGAGAIAVITLLFTIVNGIATFKQSADQQANEQFFRAAQMAISGMSDQKIDTAASSDNLKTAAIYSLKNTVLANPEYCDMVTSILLGEISENTKKRKEAGASKPLSPRVDASVSAAILVLGTIPPCFTGRSIRLTEQYLGAANFGNTKYFNGADLRAAALSAAYLGWANFDYARFDGAEMADYDTFSNFAKSQYGNVPTFDDAKMSENWSFQKYNYIVNFENSSLRCATFLNTSVSGASFANADLYGANFGNTNLSRADFTGVKNLRTIAFQDACYDEEPIVDKDQRWFIDVLRKQRRSCSTKTKTAQGSGCQNQ
jgi:uncharacterized protein YjbI with pentapeptide repeats